MSKITLEEVRLRLTDCRKCELCETRTNIVLGSGNPQAEVMLIGEAPGRNEDEGGLPFIGAAGKRLDMLLELSGLKREDIYIANLLKCRPPGNHDPTPFEVDMCADYLRDQVRAIWPKVIVTLGRFASQFILKTDMGITHLRGRSYVTGAFKVLPTFHPAASIYDQKKLPLLEHDFGMIKELLT
ncbi:MAG: uracil-DNA glycosylase [Coriobacteriales bacterium]|jgi:DNA polymerase|nr:uracil-DNA glycosylase [Coriobacteriales bacterium]